ncbi:MAG: UDP-3-O-acyl-N-acetylglucosamine deacetylase [Candidatus Aminicenantales bacterium]
MKKRTLKHQVQFAGRGVHTGKKVVMNLKPSDSGRLIFRRLDLGGAELELDYRAARAESSSVLESGPVAIRTVEHLLAALYVFGIDSLDVEVTAEEIPIGDGSALPFVNLIRQAGIEFLTPEKKILKVIKPLTVEKGEARLSFFPAPDLLLSYSIDYAHPAIGHQVFHGPLRLKNFVDEIAPARTFGFLRDVPVMLERGLARGGTLENAIILNEKGPLNPPLRYADEFVRHKMLDLIGDLALSGRPILARVEVFSGGHSLHQLGISTLLESECWVEVENTAPFFLAELVPGD